MSSASGQPWGGAGHSADTGRCPGSTSASTLAASPSLGIPAGPRALLFLRDRTDRTGHRQPAYQGAGASAIQRAGRV